MADKHSIEDYLNHIGAQTPSHGHGWRKMKCPFHDDRTASAAVNYEENRFKCHGCGVAGDTYDLIRNERGGSLREAIEYAQTISTQGDEPVRFAHRSGGGISSHPRAVGRRSAAISSRSSRRTATGT